MERELEVHLWWHARTVQIGVLWVRARGARETASYEYTPAWLATRDAFAIDPELPLGRGRFHSDRAVFNAFTDPAPDRWGQTLLRRFERVRARSEGRAVRTLMAIDFLTLVNDETRLGAIRLREPGGTTFLSENTGVPPLVQLPRLLRATRAVLEERETVDDLALLLAPGTSLGGARPKASIRNRAGALAIAKFPGRDEDWPVVPWEAATLAMAAAAGITVPARTLETILRKPVLVLERFDREQDNRIPFISALTAMGAREGDARVRSYLEIAEALRADGASARADLAELWRRIVFNILVSNTDDHLRNHGFLRRPNGWKLSPAFDLNPMPTDVRPRVHALAINEDDPTSSLELARSISGSFGLRSQEARTIIKEVAKPLRRWRDFARQQAITAAQIDRMSSAFEHEDSVAAQAL
jgi:serine/threonine-protein kinase HipA